jgi:TIR domain
VSEVFISYVREDGAIVEHLCRVLKANGIKVWLDKEQLEPGVRWRSAIENAIRRGVYFISIFSRARQSKPTSYANEELVLAIEQLRKKAYGTTWFIPIKIDECEIEARPIGGGETILDFQICDLRRWGTEVPRLLKVLGVSEPNFDLRRPLGAGLPSVLEVRSGFVRYDMIEGAPELLQGMEHRVVTGWCRRMDSDDIVAYFELFAPLKPLQEFNRLLGYTGFHALCLDTEISRDPNAPSRFIYDRSLVAPAGTPIPNPAATGMMELPFDLPLRSQFVADGYISGDIFSGKFFATVEVTIGDQKQIQPSNGIFEMNMQEPIGLQF